MKSYSLDKMDLVALVRGHRAPAAYDANYDQYKHLSRYTGNQHNESWDWDLEALAQLSENELWGVHVGLKGNKKQSNS